jgi:hypothetical protein
MSNIAHAFEPELGVASPIEETVYAGVRATYADSPSRTLQLYYGPSSNFPMIQHIHQRLSARKREEEGLAGGEEQEDPKAIEEVDEGLERFQYRGIFFGKHSDSQETSFLTSASGRGGGDDLIRPQHNEDSNLLFLPYHLAADFLNKFLTTLQRHLPFVQQAPAEELLTVLYGNNLEARELDIGEKAILLAVLAIGATLTEYTAWAETLFKRSRALADELHDVVNVHVCQLELLLAHYQSIGGKPNSVYLLVGTAMRKAMAAGLHKEALSKSRQSVDFAMVQERRLTFWSIYIFEVTISFGLGRPISINDCDISIPYPEEHAFFNSLVSLARIYSRAARQLYGSKQGSLLALYRDALALKRDLDVFRASLPEELKIGPTAPFGPNTTDVLRLFLNNWYYHALILIFRPFLIFHAQWQKDHRLSISNTAERIEVSKRQLNEKAPWIFEACAHCVKAARELLICLSKSMEVNDLVRRLSYAGFYMECGAFLLIFNMLRDRKELDEDKRVVQMALRAMETMHNTQPRNISMAAIRRMLALVEGADEDEGMTTSPESSAGIVGTPSISVSCPVINTYTHSLAETLCTGNIESRAAANADTRRNDGGSRIRHHRCDPRRRRPTNGRL